jgi:hypothetical protein
MPRTTQGLAAVVTPPSEQPRWRRVAVARDEQGWWVGLEGSALLECLPTLTQAIHRGRRLAHQHKPCLLTIHHADGEQERLWIAPEEHPGANP